MNDVRDFVVCLRCNGCLAQCVEPKLYSTALCLVGPWMRHSKQDGTTGLLRGVAAMDDGGKVPRAMLELTVSAARTCGDGVKLDDNDKSWIV